MPQQIANYVQTTLASAITNAATTATLTSVAGLPTTGPFRLVIKDAAPATTFEICEVTSVNVGTGVVTFTGGAGVGRGLEGTSAIAHSAGALVGNDITAAMLQAAFPNGAPQATNYAQITANQGSITVQVDVTGLAVTVVLPANRRIRVSAYGLVGSTVLNDLCRLVLMEGATQLQQDEQIIAGSTGTTPAVSPEVVLTPSAGSHTYKVQALRAGTGSMTIFAAATNPAFILVEDLGSAT